MTPATQRETPPAVLHNMSSKPRTMVDVSVLPIDESLVSFSLDGMGPALNRVVKGRTRATVRSSLAAFACQGAVEALATQLDRAWAARSLRGAVLLYECLPAQRATGATQCRDPLVVLNVLARARGNVLLPDAPLVLHPTALDRQLMTDDPRLTAMLTKGRYTS